jgi:hypothetical protein
VGLYPGKGGKPGHRFGWDDRSLSFHVLTRYWITGGMGIKATAALEIRCNSEEKNRRFRVGITEEEKERGQSGAPSAKFVPLPACYLRAVYVITSALQGLRGHPWSYMFLNVGFHADSSPT